MKGRWHAVRHEDRCTPGVPDVSYGMKGKCGWIELKALPKWPRNLKAIVKLPGLTPDQKAWLRDRGSQSGSCYLMIRIGRDYLLYRWHVVHLLGSLDTTGMYRTARAFWSRSIDWDEFEEFLSQE
jgi:hypothetical protein